MVSGGDQHVSLPPHYAFVVQLEADTQVETGQLHGRVEHVVSRQATQVPRVASGPRRGRHSNRSHLQAGCFREEKMKKTVRRIGSTCGLLALFFGSSSAHAFCTEFDILGIGVNCVGEGHKRITGYIKPILRDNIWGAVWNGNYAQDNPLGDFRDDGQRHFESCRFVSDSNEPGSIDYIQKTYRDAISHLNPADPDPFHAADNFGKLLHTVQDFYSHTNWINLLDLTSRDPVIPADLFDSSLGSGR
jgi:hypothetical protein